MVTISDVANKAGVAVSTVSKVLKNYPNVSQATKDKVNKAIADLDYVPNVMASALSSKNYRRVGLWININNQKQAIDEINMQYMFGAFSKAKELGIDILPLFSPMYAQSSEEEIIRSLRSEGITGLIVYGFSRENKRLASILDRKIFYSVVVDAPDCNEKTSAVMVDHARGQYEVTKKTVTGEYCKKLLYIAGSKNSYVTQQRLLGIEKLKKEMKFKLQVEYGNFSERAARMLTFRFGDDADVIACASDLMAIGVKNALKEMNIFRPVCGFDGISLMGYAGEHMNTVVQDFHELSQTAVGEVYRLMNGGVGKEILIPYKIHQIEYEDVIF